MTFRPLPLLTFLALPALALLIWLGSWQWQRYGEAKARGTAAPPAFETLTLVPVPVEEARSVQIYGLYRGQSAWRHTVPVAREAGGDVAGVMVVALSLTAQPPAGDPLGTFETFGGRVLALPASDKRDLFTPEERLEEGYGFTMDPVSLLAHWGIAPPVSGPLLVFEPETLRVADPENRLLEGTQFEAANPWADPALHDELPAERHLGYAITWWGLALALIGVYLAFHVSRGRLGRARTS